MTNQHNITEAIQAEPLSQSTDRVKIKISTLDKLKFKGHDLITYSRQNQLNIPISKNLQKLFEETNQNNKNYLSTVLWATTYINSPITLLAVDNLSYVNANLEAQYKVLYTDKSTPRILDSTPPDDDTHNRFSKFGMYNTIENCIESIRGNKRSLDNKIKSILESQGVKNADRRSKVEACVLAVANHFISDHNYSVKSKRIFQLGTNHMLHMKSTYEPVTNTVRFMANRYYQLYIDNHPTTFAPTTPDTIDPDVARETLPNDIDEITIDVNGNVATPREITVTPREIRVTLTPVTPIPATLTTQGDAFLNDLHRAIIDRAALEIVDNIIDNPYDTDDEVINDTYDPDEDAIADTDEAEQLIDGIEEVIDPPTNEGEVIQDTDIEVIDLTQLPNPVPLEHTPAWIPPAVPHLFPDIPNIPGLR